MTYRSAGGGSPTGVGGRRNGSGRRRWLRGVDLAGEGARGPVLPGLPSKPPSPRRPRAYNALAAHGVVETSARSRETSGEPSSAARCGAAGGAAPHVAPWHASLRQVTSCHRRPACGTSDQRAAPAPFAERGLQAPTITNGFDVDAPVRASGESPGARRGRRRAPCCPGRAIAARNVPAAVALSSAGQRRTGRVGRGGPTGLSGAGARASRAGDHRGFDSRMRRGVRRGAFQRRGGVRNPGRAAITAGAAVGDYPVRASWLRWTSMAASATPNRAFVLEPDVPPPPQPAVVGEHLSIDAITIAGRLMGPGGSLTRIVGRRPASRDCPTLDTTRYLLVIVAIVAFSSLRHGVNVPWGRPGGALRWVGVLARRSCRLRGTGGERRIASEQELRS